MQTPRAYPLSLKGMALSTSQRNLLIGMRLLLVVLSLLAIFDFLTSLR